MPRPTIQLSIPQPCAESWDAMTPRPGGRHCAACQKVVVDFTHKTDVEILAYLAGAASREVCGRLYVDQQHRPLLPAALPPPAARWRTWLTLALAAWGAGRAEAAPAPVLPPVHHTPPKAAPKRRSTTRAAKYVQGVVRDAGSGEPLAGVAVFLLGENRQATTDANGWFGLRLSPRRPRGGRALVLHYTNYLSETVPLPAATRPVTRLRLTLHPDAVTAEGASVVGYGVQVRREVTGGAIASISVKEIHLRKPWPWHPRSFYYWSRYWLTRPFRRAPKTADL